MPAQTYFPLWWESTGDQWWYASPIDFAAANGQYDLVRELLRLDGNHLMKLTSLRRIRRLETVWDDEEQYHDVAKCQSQVARKLLLECEIKKGKNSLIGDGYGGWLLYTAASAGDLSFVQELLERDPLLVFGEGEYGVTDILYAAARCKNSEVFRVVLDFAATPRITASDWTGEVPSAYKFEIMNRALHAAARGGDLRLLKELLGDCSDDASSYRDDKGATILHAAAAKGQVEIVEDNAITRGLIDYADNEGNTALHVAARTGQLAVVEALILASPASIHARNSNGEIFLHAVVTGFQTPSFQRLDRQIELMKHLLSGKIFGIKDVINAKNNDGRTVLHLAIIGNIHSDIVKLLMSVSCVDKDIRDVNVMTPTNILKKRARSTSSEQVTRQVISGGGIFEYRDYSARKVIASHIKKQSIGNSPGTSFRINDTEIFLCTGALSISEATRSAAGLTILFTDHSQHDSSMETRSSPKIHKSDYVNFASRRIKRLLHWPKIRNRTSEMSPKKLVDARNSVSTSEEIPVPLRQRFSKPSPLPHNKRALSVRSNQPSPTAKKKLASGMIDCAMQAIPHYIASSRSRSSSFSKLSMSSQSSLDAQQGAQIENEIARHIGCNVLNENSNLRHTGLVNKRFLNQYLCFSGAGQPVEAPVSGLQPYEAYERSVLSTA
ncbi:uncharacterized protein [Primulina eburnea]|uniref:uncharacterized protein n=1 Tax=Primulina eburnea TaxID=1245227 RepID=UPI003C6C25AA